MPRARLHRSPFSEVRDEPQDEIALADGIRDIGGAQEPDRDALSRLGEGRTHNSIVRRPSFPRASWP